MVVNDMIEAGMRAFKENLTRFCEEHAEEALTPESAHGVTEGIQQAIAAVGRAAFGAYLEAKEEKEDVVAVGGETFRFKYRWKKQFHTLWGAMAIERGIYQNASDTKTFVPLDAAWGMKDEFMTMEVREAVAFSSAHVTPEETHALLEKSALFHPHPTQIKRCLEKMGDRITAHRGELDEQIRQDEPVPERTRVLAASLDGANVLLNEPGVKKGRPAERPTGDKAQTTKTSYHNAMVGSVSFYGEVPEGAKSPQRLAARYTSHMPEECAPSFKEKFEAELAAAEQKLPGEVIKVLVCDGARPLWNYIEQNRQFDGYEKIIDYWHSLEHLSLAAEALFGKGSNEAADWYGKYAKKLKEEDNGARSVLHSMDYFEKTRRLSKSARKDLATQRTFFRRNCGKMDYAGFRRRGLPIGSGPVEAACKTLIKARLCRSGMRWSRQGGQRILDLRTYVKSNRWNAFWKHYNELEAAA